MNKLQKSINGVRVFFEEVMVEMKKCTWPEKNELLESTVVVIVSVLLLSLFVGVSDKILVSILRLMVPSG